MCVCVCCKVSNANDQYSRLASKLSFSVLINDIHVSVLRLDPFMLYGFCKLIEIHIVKIFFHHHFVSLTPSSAWSTECGIAHRRTDPYRSRGDVGHVQSCIVHGSCSEGVVGLWITGGGPGLQGTNRRRLERRRRTGGEATRLVLRVTAVPRYRLWRKAHSSWAWASAASPVRPSLHTEELVVACSGQPSPIQELRRRWRRGGRLCVVDAVWQAANWHQQDD